MVGPGSKKRKIECGMRGKISRQKKKVKKQTTYHSDSSSEEALQQRTDFHAVDLNGSDEETSKHQALENLSDDEEAFSAGADTDAENTSFDDGEGSNSESGSDSQSEKMPK